MSGSGDSADARKRRFSRINALIFRDKHNLARELPRPLCMLSHGGTMP